MEITLKISPPVTNEQLNALFTAAWESHSARDFSPILAHSLLYVCAYADDQLVGFVNLAWDGGSHAFLLDTSVHPALQRRGIGIQVVQAGIMAACERGIEWIHVDYEPHLHSFYSQCGFIPTPAGLINLK
ncbi:MAG: GNAT family N-acetyltransferase [Chloroflexi bacterium]|nr:GNAT family N-acetyltransferase [Chloroflexota bacterium]